MTIEIKLRKGEPMDRAIRRLKSAWIVKSTIRDVREKRLLLRVHQIKKEKLEKSLLSLQMLRTALSKHVNPGSPS